MDEVKGFDLAALRYKLLEVESYLRQAHSAIANGNVTLADNTIECAAAFLRDAQEIVKPGAGVGNLPL